jgi:hypothetical protein
MLSLNICRRMLFAVLAAVFLIIVTTRKFSRPFSEDLSDDGDFADFACDSLKFVVLIVELHTLSFVGLLAAVS